MWVSGRRVERRGDRHPPAVVDVPPPRHRPHQRLGVRPGQHPEPVGQAGQHAVRLEPVQQPLGAVRAGREHHLAGGDVRVVRRASQAPVRTVWTAYPPRPSTVGPAAGPQWADRDHRPVRAAPRRRPARRGRGSSGQGVLGVVPAAGHAGAALHAGTPRRAGAAEERIRHLGARRRTGRRRRRRPPASGGTCRPTPISAATARTTSSAGVMVGFVTTPSIRSAWS